MSSLFLLPQLPPCLPPLLPPMSQDAPCTTTAKSLPATAAMPSNVSSKPQHNDRERGTDRGSIRRRREREEDKRGKGEAQIGK